MLRDCLAQHAELLDTDGDHPAARTLRQMRRALSVLRRGRSDYTATPTHPSLTLRRELLRESLLVLPLNEKARADAIANGKTVEFVAELLWDRTYRALKDLHRRGTELAPWWQS